MAVRNTLSNHLDEIIDCRRKIHSYPELLFDTFKTSELVSKKLREFGCDKVTTGIAKTGVIGVIKGKSTTSGKTIGLRADMDALPIEEETNAPYASKVKGVMHACGHDGHTVMLLAAARNLCEHRNFNGSVAVIFQPAEEGGGGGEEMVKEGIIDTFQISEIYGMHNMPSLSVGQFAIKPGPFFAASDNFYIEVTGRGGHAAKPHEGVDPIVTASHLVTCLQSIVSRNNDPLEELVISVTSFRSNSNTYNVIPQKVRLKGTVRTLKETARLLAENKITEVCKGVAISHGANITVNYNRGYPIMANSELETGYAIEAARKVSDKVIDNSPAIMGSEDFAYMLNACPGAYILVGNGDTAPLHHPEYDFNDEIITTGASWWIELAELRLPLAMV